MANHGLHPHYVTVPSDSFGGCLLVASGGCTYEHLAATGHILDRCTLPPRGDTTLHVCMMGLGRSATARKPRGLSSMSNAGLAERLATTPDRLRAPTSGRHINAVRRRGAAPYLAILFSRASVLQGNHSLGVYETPDLSSGSSTIT